MRVGVIGAGGRLGGLIVAHLEGRDVEVVAVDPRPERHVAADDVPVPVPVRRAGSRLADLFSDLEAVVVTAPLTDADLHRAAVRSGCHVVDVAVGAEVNRGLLALDADAVAASRSVIVMAGLVPGLTSLLGGHVLERFSPTAVTAAVALVQSPTGTAGEQGTREMLDLMTRRDAEYRSWPVQAPTGAIHSIRLFDMHSIEPQSSGLDTRLELGTGFEGARMHGLLRTIRLLRVRAPAVYAPFRDAVARRKARAPGRRETTSLSAVALDETGTPVGGRLVTVTSDYAATAAVAAAAAIAAAARQTQPGAGDLRRYFTLQQLLEDPLLQSVVSGDTGDLLARPTAG